MLNNWSSFRFIWLLVFLSLAFEGVWADEEVFDALQTKPPPATEATGEASLSLPAGTPEVEATIVNPYQKADVVARISGVIREIKFKEGEFIEKGQVVVEFDDQRSIYEVEKLTHKLRSLEESLALAKRELEVYEELYSSEAAALQEILKKRSEVINAEASVREATADLAIAKLNLAYCKVEAPFSGYLAALYKQAFEGCSQLEKVFQIVDPEKIYTVGNVPIENVASFKRGGKALFISSTGSRFEGTVERAGKVIDPKSRTKKIYVLIDNEDGRLEVGMTGSLRAVQ